MKTLTLAMMWTFLPRRGAARDVLQWIAFVEENAQDDADRSV